MADITKCKGDECSIKESCYRFTAKASEFWQSWFLNSPIKDGKCDMFWGVENDYTMKQIKDILNGEK